MGAEGALVYTAGGGYYTLLIRRSKNKVKDITMASSPQGGVPATSYPSLDFSYERGWGSIADEVHKHREKRTPH